MNIELEQTKKYKLELTEEEARVVCFMLGRATTHMFTERFGSSVGKLMASMECDIYTEFSNLDLEAALTQKEIKAGRIFKDDLD